LAGFDTKRQLGTGAGLIQRKASAFAVGHFVIRTGGYTMNAKDIMSYDVVTIGPDDTIQQAAGLMLRNRFSGLPVVDAGGALIGIITEGDFLRRNETGTLRRRSRWMEFLLGPGRLGEEYTHAAGRHVREVMTHEVYTVEEDTPLQTLVELMDRHRVKRLPVTHGGQLVGMITRTNLVRAVAHAIPDAPTRSSDKTIRERLLEELKDKPWAPLAIDPVVTDGKVRLLGAITDERQREAMIVAAENIPGVKSVEDELVWIEPMSGMVIEPRAA
jgi:CBS domain-containing protein